MSSGSELLEKIKTEYCDNCELSLRCMMGREIDQPHYCARCQGIIMDDVTVQCTCFSQIALGVNQQLHVMPFRGKGVLVQQTCPACSAHGGGRLIVGFVEGRE